ncbi:Ivy family C-type lysozyme inhibitor [Citrobacter sp. JGM124]|uniref:Ivy family C-type lysozyme inhibitor n=1 Tax=Citrobacter sp. JGM124 TaxID=2799789 RepID=UPI001BA551E7|nr:Ivy family C-type lysozyme inhibitor [Citrobacter sp. JGM124]MBS0849859.1 Ivy family C-type lysozyme inhibitor [Citrobacter sp. JGM124]
MKRALIALALSCSVLSAHAVEPLTVSRLATDKTTADAFKTMVGSQKLPEWVTQGGTTSPNQDVVIDGHKYVVLNSCKPHDCSAQSIAVLYSPESRSLAGVFSELDEQAVNQKLTWLNISDNLSIDGKTILFAALTGSLDNHPDSFNFK